MKALALNLTDEQEGEMVEWLQTYPELYDKGHKKYKDTALKSKLWENKSSKLGVEFGALLHVWYKSMRTRYGKIRKMKSGDRSRDLAARDEWILSKCSFIAPHIYVCPNRGPDLVDRSKGTLLQRSNGNLAEVQRGCGLLASSRMDGWPGIWASCFIRFEAKSSCVYLHC
ncbi:uncharacterized protein LOC121389843 [Gigantopelta aegis]|uniref:uncharacterized protein LOC121389843 n=1 Tax=Gigantopelta aegis TaxID=1735272 RepID=UPI001B8898B6|nr:uncharacterized protein LOC121389843 [Gigantopelta aegis]